MSATAQFDEAARRLRHLTSGPNRPRLKAIARLLNGLFLGMLVLLVAGVGGLAIYASTHANHVFAGVSVAGIPLGGLTESEAQAELESRFAAYAATPMTLTLDEQSFTITPAAIGAELDAAATAAEAYAFGRDGSILDRSRAWARGLLSGTDIAPVITIDGAAFASQLDPIAASVTRAPSDAWINMSDAAEPLLVADLPGVTFDYAANQAAILENVATLSSDPVILSSLAEPATVSASSLIPSLDRARASVAAPLTISAPEGSWHIPTSDLRHVVSVNGSTGEVLVNRDSLRAMVESLAPNINRDAANAALTVDDNGQLAVVPSVERAVVDIDGSVAAIEAAVIAGSGEAALLVDRTAPAITDEMAAAAVERGEGLINAGVHLTWNGGEAEFGRFEMLRALTIQSRPGEAEPFVFGVDPTIVADLLAPIADGFDVEAADARFRLINNEVRLVSEARDGRALETEAAVEDIIAAFGDAQPEVEIAVTTVKPEVTAADRSKIVLGDDVLAEASTYYGQSSEPRRLNVERGVELETGWLVAPNGVFSFADSLGVPIDEDNGFVTGFGIVANESGGVTTAPVIGGGICQVSTTMFQAIYWAGLAIEERWQHPYYLRSYGEAPQGLPGLDAMVNIEPDWVLDLKFRNTTDHWLVVLLTADGENVRARIVGTDPGWDVRVDDPVITNIVRASTEMHYTDSPELENGRTLLVESADDGFDVAITRRVVDDGKVILEDTTRSTFSPSRNLTLRGTGTGSQ